MGSKNKKRNRSAAPAPPQPERSTGAPWPLIAGVAVIVAAGGIYIAMAGGADTPATPATATADATVATAPAPAAAETAAATPTATSAAQPAAAQPAATTATEPLPADLPMPPLPYVPSAAAGPPELMQQAYVFAARNPHVLDYVPCYCGCGQTDGHVGNTDCFVERRAPNGAVEAWDTHGMT